MGVYVLTVFEKDGSKALDESFEAATEKEAKAKGESILQEKGLYEKTHRCTSSAGSLFYSSAKRVLSASFSLYYIFVTPRKHHI